MNLEQVAHYIAHPHELGLAEAPALKSMSEKHPYAAVFSLLYLTALANGKSVDLDDALQQHAYKLSDRTKLYHLVAGSSILEETPASTVEEDASTSPFGGGSRGRTESTTDGAHTADESEAVLPAEPIDTTVSQDKDISEDIPVISPSNDDEARPAETDFHRITEAFTREQHFGVTDSEIDDYQADEMENADEPVIVPENIPEEVLPLNPPPKGEVVRSFTSWLKSGDHSSGPAEEMAKTERATLVVPIGDQPEPEPLKRTVDAIIDNFIKEEPTITRGKTEFFSPSRKAKESLDEEAVPVSETLAKIFAAQGNYPKAIHVYHQLMLSFPEKKSFFAIQIEALKKKITP